MAKYIAAFLVVFMVVVLFVSNNDACGGCAQTCTITAEQFNEVKPQGSCCDGAYCRATASGRECHDDRLCVMWGDEAVDSVYLRWVNNELQKRHERNLLRERFAKLLARRDEELVKMKDVAENDEMPDDY